MKTIVRIDVTAEDIARGSRCVATGCPVALAFHRQLPKENVAVVATTLAYYGPHDSRLPLRFPPATADRIREFDRGNGMEPFSFDVEIDLIDDHPKLSS